MQMTDYEVKRNVLDAADQKAQIGICAQLNGVDESVIRGKLKSQGVDLRQLKGAVKKHIAERKPRTKAANVEKKSANAEDKQPTSVGDAVAAIKAQIAEINRQQYELDMCKADLYKTIWDMLGEVE